jgi:hypothetical protein
MSRYVKKKIRSAVSADRIRFKDGVHDLDLSYITDSIIGMYPGFTSLWSPLRCACACCWPPLFALCAWTCMCACLCFVVAARMRSDLSLSPPPITPHPSHSRVAMAIPGEGVERTWRNNINEVASMLFHYHRRCPVRLCSYVHSSHSYTSVKLKNHQTRVFPTAPLCATTAGSFMIYNLSERTYDYSKFHDMVG